MVGVPAAEAVAILRGRGQVDHRAVVLRDGGNGIAAVRIKGDGVPVDRPPCLDGHASRGHRGGDLSIPVGEGIALLGRIFGRGDFCAIVLPDGRQHRLAVLEGDGVPVDRPAGGEDHILCGHGGRNALIPTGEGITLSGLVRGRGDRRAVVLCAALQHRLTVLEGDGVLVHRPLCLNGHVLCGHRGGDLSIPVGEGIALLGRIFGRGDFCAIVLPDGRQHRLAVLEGDGVGLRAPLGVEDPILSGHRGSGECRCAGLVGIPAVEAAALLGGCGQSAQRCAVPLRNRRGHAVGEAAAPRVKRQRDIPAFVVQADHGLTVRADGRKAVIGDRLTVHRGVIQLKTGMIPVQIADVQLSSGGSLAVYDGVIAGEQIAAAAQATGVVLHTVGRVATLRPLRGIGNVAGHRNAGSILSKSLIPGKIIADQLQRGERDRASVLGIYGGLLIAALRSVAEGHLKAPASVIDIDHGAAVRQNGQITDAVRTEAIVALRLRRRLRQCCAGQSFGLEQLVIAVQLLLVVPDGIGGIRIGGPLGINRDAAAIRIALVLLHLVRHAVFRAGEASAVRVPAGEGIALPRDRGRGNTLSNELGHRLAAGATVGVEADEAGIRHIAPQNMHRAGNGLGGEGQWTAHPRKGDVAALLNAQVLSAAIDRDRVAHGIIGE